MDGGLVVGLVRVMQFALLSVFLFVVRVFFFSYFLLRLGRLQLCLLGLLILYNDELDFSLCGHIPVQSPRGRPTNAACVATGVGARCLCRHWRHE